MIMTDELKKERQNNNATQSTMRHLQNIFILKNKQLNK